MRKMMLLATMVAMAALMMAAAPAMADDWNDWNDDEDFCWSWGVWVCDNDFDRLDLNDDGFGNFDQEAQSGDVNQSFDVSQTGDNSNQTVGIQGVANTGNAQNQLGVIDAGNGFGDFNNDDQFCNDFEGDNFFCEDLEDFCDDFDRDGLCDFFFDNNDRFFFGDNDGDIEFEDSGASIEVSPTNTVNSSQQVNQTAAASAPHHHWVWTAWGWMWV